MKSRPPNEECECGYFTMQEANDIRRLLVKAEELLKLVEQKERTSWLVNTMKFWALWASAILLALTGGIEALKNVAKRLLQ